MTYAEYRFEGKGNPSSSFVCVALNAPAFQQSWQAAHENDKDTDNFLVTGIHKQPKIDN
jgi:hypothetical protein